MTQSIWTAIITVAQREVTPSLLQLFLCTQMEVRRPKTYQSLNETSATVSIAMCPQHTHLDFKVNGRCQSDLIYAHTYE